MLSFEQFEAKAENFEERVQDARKFFLLGSFMLGTALFAGISDATDRIFGNPLFSIPPAKDPLLYFSYELIVPGALLSGVGLVKRNSALRGLSTLEAQNPVHAQELARRRSLSARVNK